MQTNGFMTLITPNAAKVPNLSMQAVWIGWIAAIIGLWTLLPGIFPSPLRILAAYDPLWNTWGLGDELLKSLTINLHALFFVTLITLSLSYATRVPIMRPIVTMITKGRFMGITGLTLIFTFLTPDAYWLKVSLLVFGMSVFTLTSMVAVVENIPKAKYDHARTLRMSEPWVIWYVVVIGTIDQAIEVIRQNNAIGWAMLTAVEGLVISGGGVGALLKKNEKYLMLAELFAVQFAILTMGMLIDYAFKYFRNTVCPYANMGLEREGS